MKCNKIPEKYITLDCEHDICLLCISNTIMSKNQLEKLFDATNDFDYECDLCSNITVFEKFNFYRLIFFV